MKLTGILLTIICATVLAAGIACGGKSASHKNTPTPTATPTSTATASEVNIDASYNGGEVTLATCQQLFVTLDSN